MAHEIQESDNLALSNQDAWHKLGTVLDHAMTPAEALATAELDWEVRFSDSLVGNFGATAIEDPDHRLLVRMARENKFYRNGQAERNIIVGMHGTDYVPMQNADLLNMAYMFGEQVKVETAGSLFNGRKVFALLQGETLNIKGDEVVQYLALMNGHDGKLSLSAMPTSVRIVCNNTLNMALRADSKKMFKVRHSTNMEQRMKDIASALKVFQETGSSFHKAIERMSESEIKNQAQLDRFWRAVYNHNFLRLGGDQEQKIKIAQASVVDADINTLLESVLSDDQISARRAVFENWQTTMDIESMQIGQNPNMWLAANAITGWHQKSEPGKKMEGWEERNLVSTCFGDKDDMSAEVMQTALAMG